MSIWNRVREAVNNAMMDKSEQILEEVKEAGYKYYPDSTIVVPSFRIMGKGESGEISGDIRKGLITKVRIGSDLREAYWAVYGNGGHNAIITPTHTRRDGRLPMLGKYPDGIPGYGWLPQVHGYDGHNFVKEVAKRHR